MKTFFAAIFVLLCGFMNVKGQYWRPEIIGGGGGNIYGDTYGGILVGGGLHYHFTRRSSFGIVITRVKPFFPPDSRIPRNYEYDSRLRITFENESFTRVEAIYRYHFSELVWWEWGVGKGGWKEKFSAYRPFSNSFGYMVSQIDYASPPLQYPVVNISNKLGFLATNRKARSGFLGKLGCEFWLFYPSSFYKLKIDHEIYPDFYLRPTHGLYFLFSAEFGLGGRI